MNPTIPAEGVVVDTRKGRIPLAAHTLMQMTKIVNDGLSFGRSNNYGVGGEVVLALIGSHFPEAAAATKWAIWQWATTQLLVPYINAGGDKRYWRPADEGWNPFSKDFTSLMEEVSAVILTNGPSSKKQINAALPEKPHTKFLDRALYQLIENGVIETMSKGKRGHEVTYYTMSDRLSEAALPEPDPAPEMGEYHCESCDEPTDNPPFGEDRGYYAGLVFCDDCRMPS